MLIVNADDWGRSVPETDAALHFSRNGRVSAVSAMVFMEDSQRAAELALQHEIDAGLHINFSESYTGAAVPNEVKRRQAAVVRFMRSSKYASVVYNPFLRSHFKDIFRSQYDEFVRLYRKAPSHIDGHQHRHLSTNVLIDKILPAGGVVRRNFSFRPGEKGFLNRCYRNRVDRALRARHKIVDYFFSLKQMAGMASTDRVFALAERNVVEFMVHPAVAKEYEWLQETVLNKQYSGVEVVTFGSVATEVSGNNSVPAYGN